MKHLILILFVVGYSCKLETENQVIKYAEFEFAVADNKPVFEDEYLYGKLSKKCIIEKVNGIDIYHFDWNNNGNFKEYGIDYIGVKSNLEYKPTITKLDTTKSITINGIIHELKIIDGYTKLNRTDDFTETDISVITELTPIVLENGKTFYPEITSDSTVIYFWATWCLPCIETLKNIDVQKLRNSGINLIPIAYNCSNSKTFLKENNLNFEDLIISDKSANVYNIKSLSKQYTFLKYKEVSNSNVDLKKYYH